MRAVHHVSQLARRRRSFSVAAPAPLPPMTAPGRSANPPARSGSRARGAQPASLKQEELLKPGDTVRTGRNGRVLLQRGEESMMISPNSVVGRARREEGRSVDDDRAAGRLDPARSRKAQRQAFRGRDPLPRRRGQGHAVSRHRECVEHQRRRDPRPGRGRRFPDRPDRAGNAGPARDDLRAWQWRSFAERHRAPSARSSKASRARPRSNGSGSESRPSAPRAPPSDRPSVNQHGAHAS